jgi:hypothetical protein
MESMLKITIKSIGSGVAQMRRSASHTMAVALLFAGASYGQESSLVAQTPEVGEARLTVDESASALAFGKYIASLRERNPFTESGPINMEVEASLPGLAKHGKMLMVRETGASERTEYSAIRFDGDSTIKQQVIARYLDAEDQAEALPYSTVAVTPANYRFRYLGSVENNETTVFVFQIVPKKKRTGLIRGQIWIDSATGIVVHQEGRLVKRPSVFIRTIEVRRDTNLRDGFPYSRVTHVAIETRLAVSAELTITERPWQAAEQQLITQRGMR